MSSYNRGQGKAFKAAQTLPINMLTFIAILRQNFFLKTINRCAILGFMIATEEIYPLRQKYLSKIPIHKHYSIDQKKKDFEFF
jgi:hypothetical protein